jgi:asparagine synthase (glutamine-hydrolysing)
MCGIAGYIDFSKQSNGSILEDMTAVLEHRGPDGSGTFLINQNHFQLGFGHRRLAIIDLSPLGKQPMSFGSWTIVFNGEIYNFQEIKNELTDLGHTFQTHSDTEMILHAYAQWGADCLNRFIGMFAFVLFNEETLELFMARDRAGVKPFFYSFHRGLFLFASELKSFHQHPNFEKIINPNAVYSFLQYGSVPTPHCIFEHCHKLKPGHFIQTNLNNFQLEEHPYWNVYDYYNKAKLDISIEEAKAHTKTLLQSACNYRMVADVPVGVFLSGGYDSAAVTALLQENRLEPLKTYTIAVPDIGLNEADFAKETARILGTDHTETSCTAREAIDLIADLPSYYDEPFADSSAIPTTLVSKIARQHVTVALSADGGDEVFAGYNRYEMLLKFGQKLNKIPDFARKGIAATMDLIPAHRIPVLKNKYNFAQRYEKTKGILRNSSSNSLMLSLSQLFTNEQINTLASKEYQPLHTYYDSTELKNISPLAFAQSMDYQTYLLDDILQKVDRASMTASLESREPLLDHRIIEFVAQLPDDYKIRNGEKKWLLKEIVHEYIPREFMDRPKMGFAIPIEHWLKNELRDLLETYVNQQQIEATQLLNWTEVDKLKTAFLSGKKEYGVKIWYLLSFLMWFEKWGK